MMPHTPNPMHVAQTAQNMAEKAEGADAKLFQKVALVSMAVVALSSLSQVAIELLRRAPNKDRDEVSRRSR